MSVGMSRDEALEYIDQHPDEKCSRCHCALPKSEGDDGIHEVLLRICVDCMMVENQEMRDDMGGVCGTCAPNTATEKTDD